MYTHFLLLSLGILEGEFGHWVPKAQSQNWSGPGQKTRHDLCLMVCQWGVRSAKSEKFSLRSGRVTEAPLALLVCIEPPARSHGPGGSLTSSLLYFLFVKMPLQMIRWVVFGEKWWTGPWQAGGTILSSFPSLLHCSTEKQVICRSIKCNRDISCSLSTLPSL